MYLVLGGSGNLGLSICKHLMLTGKQYVTTNSSTLNISNKNEVDNIISDQRITNVINCVAYTDVDGCERDKEKAKEVNYIGALNVAKSCKKFNKKLIHISTDYVFDGLGDDPYSEWHPTDAVQYYGESKSLAERAVLSNDGVVARVQWILGYEKKNFVTWVIDSLKNNKPIFLSIHQYGAPTSCKFLAYHIVNLAKSKESDGIYHLSHDDFVNRYECGLFLAEKMKIDHSGILNPVDSVSFGLAQRPVNTRLSNKRYKKQFMQGLVFDWKNDVSEYLEAIYGLENI